MNYPSGVASACNNIATTFLLKGELDSANYYISTSVSIARRLNDSELPSYLTTLGRIQRRKKNYDEALDNAKTAYKMAVEQNVPLVIVVAAGLISDIYSETGRKDLAFDYQKEYYIINNQINQTESKNSLQNFLPATKLRRKNSK